MSSTFVNKIVAIIPARGGSKRVVGKNMKPIAGKPLIQYTIDQAVAALGKDNVFVSTDCPVIQGFCESRCKVIERPAELATDTASSESALAHAINKIADEFFIPEYVVFLQCTSPIRAHDDIQRAIAHIIENDADSLVSLCQQSPFVWQDLGDGPTPITYDPDNRPRSQELKVYVENGSIFIFRTSAFMMEHNRFCGKLVPFLMASSSALDIDDLSDFEYAASILSRCYHDPIVEVRDSNSGKVIDFVGVDYGTS